MAYVYSVGSLISYFCSIFICWLVDQTKEFKKAFFWTQLLCFVALGLLTLLLEIVSASFHFWIYSILFTLILIGQFTIYNLSIEYACETTFPVDETVSSGIILSLINVFGMVIAKLCEICIMHLSEVRYASHLVMFIFTSVGLVLVFFLSGFEVIR